MMISVCKPKQTKKNFFLNKEIAESESETLFWSKPFHANSLKYIGHKNQIRIFTLTVDLAFDLTANPLGNSVPLKNYHSSPCPKMKDEVGLEYTL